MELGPTSSTPLPRLLGHLSARRNSQRLELMYLSGSHSLAPDVFELGEACQGKDAAAKLEAARPLDAAASGEEGVGVGGLDGGWGNTLREAQFQLLTLRTA